MEDIARLIYATFPITETWAAHGFNPTKYHPKWEDVRDEQRKPYLDLAAKIVERENTEKAKA
jgi:hypothetical protein